HRQRHAAGAAGGAAPGAARVRGDLRRSQVRSPRGEPAVRRSWAAITVGGLVIVAVAIGAVMFKYITEGVGKGKGIVVWALFSDAKGIYEKSRVLSAGLEVGQIEKR